MMSVMVFQLQEGRHGHAGLLVSSLSHYKYDVNVLSAFLINFFWLCYVFGHGPIYTYMKYFMLGHVPFGFLYQTLIFYRSTVKNVYGVVVFLSIACYFLFK
jgi:hypothetical protein